MTRGPAWVCSPSGGVAGLCCRCRQRHAIAAEPLGVSMSFSREELWRILVEIGDCTTASVLATAWTSSEGEGLLQRSTVVCVSLASEPRGTVFSFGVIPIESGIPQRSSRRSHALPSVLSNCSRRLCTSGSHSTCLPLPLRKIATLNSIESRPCGHSRVTSACHTGYERLSVVSLRAFSGRQRPRGAADPTTTAVSPQFVWTVT